MLTLRRILRPRKVFSPESARAFENRGRGRCARTLVWRELGLALGCLALLMLIGARPANAHDWPRWRGPNLDGISAETNWSMAWPKEGPRQLWKAAVGTGFSSVAVSQGRAYTLGNSANQDTVFCLDAETGRVLWKHSYPCALFNQYNEGGPGATPTIDGNDVYTLSKEGQLFCFDAATGKVRWEKRLAQENSLATPRWGFSGSPLVDGGLLILNAGSAGMAVNKATGSVVWLSGKAAAGYATPVPLTLGGERCVLIFAAKALVCAAVNDGRELWSYPWITKWDLNIADPIVFNDTVFISSFDKGAALLKVDAHGARELWHNQNIANHFATCVMMDGNLYGIHGNTDRPPAELRCIEFASGALKWSYSGVGFGTVLAAGNKLLVLSDKGELLAGAASSNGFKPTARAQVLGGKCWTTPVLANGRLYCRNALGTLIALDLRD